MKPTDLKGVPLSVSDKQYDLVKVEREKLIKQEVGKAMKSGFIYWSNGKTVSKDKITTEELTPWLMTVSNNATKKAVEKVFGKQPVKKQKETVSSKAQ